VEDEEENDKHYRLHDFFHGPSAFTTCTGTFIPPEVAYEEQAILVFFVPGLSVASIELEASPSFVQSGRVALATRLAISSHHGMAARY
jgi:hypothetical protein